MTCPLILLCYVLITSLNVAQAVETLTISAATAYIMPDPEGMRVSEKQGTVTWSDPRQSIVWYGEWKKPGAVQVSLVAKPSATAASHWVVTLAGESHSIEGAANPSRQHPITLDAGKFSIAGPGYYKIVLSVPDIEEADSTESKPQLAAQGLATSLRLTFDGVAEEEVFFNQKPRFLQQFVCRQPLYQFLHLILRHIKQQRKILDNLSSFHHILLFSGSISSILRKEYVRKGV